MWCWKRPPDIREAAGVKYWAAGGGVSVPGDLCRTKKCIWTRRSPVAVPMTVRLSTQRGWHQYLWTRISKVGVLLMSLHSFWQMPFSKAAVCLKDTRTREFRDQTTDLIAANPVEEEGKWENERERGKGSFDACFHFKVFLFLCIEFSKTLQTQCCIVFSAEMYSPLYSKSTYKHPKYSCWVWSFGFSLHPRPSCLVQWSTLGRLLKALHK